VQALYHFQLQGFIMKAYLFAVGITIAAGATVWAQTAPNTSRPDPAEIPLPVIRTSLGTMPGVDELPVRKEMPDVMTMNDGTKVKTLEQWKARREEMKKMLEYYAVGLAPPAPGNVKGVELKSQDLAGGKVKYRLIRLTFGPQESLSLNIGVFTPQPAPAGGVPAVIFIDSNSPPGAEVLPRLPQGPNQGKSQDVLVPPLPATMPAAAPGRPGMDVLAGGGRGSPDAIATSNAAIQHGFAYVCFNYTDAGEDTTLRGPDGAFAFRTTRFYPAYPGYDWGLLRGWAWGVSRVIDYLQTDAAIDKDKLIVTGVSRNGKAALVAGAFDDRIALVAPCASSGGGTPAYRFSGTEHGAKNGGPDPAGKEGLTEMVRKYPNWFGPNLHQFWGQAEKLPFDEHFFVALCAPRPFIALEGTNDQNVNQNGVFQTWLAAKPAYAQFDMLDRVGVNWAERPHGMVAGDWDGMLAFADKHLLKKTVARKFDEFPAGVGK
jgi:hypothetical protein